MRGVKLSSVQKQAIEAHLSRFKTYLGGPEYATEKTDRTRRTAFFQKELPARLTTQKEVTAPTIELVATPCWLSMMG